MAYVFNNIDYLKIFKKSNLPIENILHVHPVCRTYFLDIWYFNLEKCQPEGWKTELQLFLLFCRVIGWRQKKEIKTVKPADIEQ